MSTSNIVLHQLGKNGPKVPALGFGAMGKLLEYIVALCSNTVDQGLSAFYGSPMSDEESHEVIKMVSACPGSLEWRF